MRPRNRLLLASASLCAALVAASGAMAQIRRFDIPPGRTSSAIVEFGRQAQLQILVPAEVVIDSRSQGVRGDLDARQALTELLRGTGLIIRADDGQVILLGRPRASQAARPAAPPPAQEPPPVLALQAPATLETGPSSRLTEVVITASRAEQSGFSASTPTTVVTSETFNRQGATNAGQLIFQHPAFKPTLSPGANNVRTATPGQSTAELRGLGGQRTLVLVNGLRLAPEAPATNTGVPVAADLNVIPSMMIDRMEVITGGASAQWGSDAVAGVVNVILKNRFEGLQLNAQYGVSDRGDNRKGRIGAIAGTDFSAGRGHVVVSAEYERNPGIGDYTQRDYLADNWQIIQNPNRNANGGYAFLRLPNVVSSLGVSGLITGPANFSLRNFSFTDDGGRSVRPFNVGSIVSGVEQYGGEGPAAFTGIKLVPAFQRVSTYGRASYVFNDRLTGTLELAYAWTEGWMNGTAPRLSTIVIQRDNAYLPAAVGQAMDAQGLTSFTMSRYATDIGNTRNVVTNKTPRATFGLEGRLGGDWSFDAHYALSRNLYDQTVSNSGVSQRYAFAQDAVRNPANGQIVCRAALQNNPAAAGCVPINLFGFGSPSAEARAYVTDTGTAGVRYSMQHAALNLRGSSLSTWAGPVSIGTGLEFRRERQVTTVNELAQAGAFLSLGNATAFRGQFTTKEIYLDTITPLARDLALARAIDLTAAIRYSDYSSVGSQTTWKLGAAYEPVQGLRFRVTESKDIRAPAIYELYGGGQLITTALSVRGQAVNIPQNVTAGNPNLNAETSKTFTAGAVLEPKAVPGLKLSVDYYDIRIRNAIVNLISQNIGNLCTQGAQRFCDLFTFNAQGVATSLYAPAQNLAQLRTSGYDFALSYNRRLRARFLPERSGFVVTLFGTYVEHAWVDTGAIGGARVDRAGENTEVNTGALPKLRLNLSESLTAGKLNLTLQQLLVGKGRIDNTYNTAPALTINDNHVPAIVTWNAYANYNLTPKVQLFAAVDNLFDKSPPQAPYPVFPVPGVNGQYYDKVGRAYRVGLTYSY